jgi:ribA/ribD-fused uncharacterized protein
MNTQHILFYEGPYYVLSNFSAHNVVYEGITYMTAEHAYQTAKFIDDDIRTKIMNAPSAFLAREYGQFEQGRTPNFDKVAVMTEIMRAKRDQHADVAAVLRNTEDNVIIKNHPDDYYWGTGADGSGENMMGKIWMELRDEMQK